MRMCLRYPEGNRREFDHRSHFDRHVRRGAANFGGFVLFGATEHEHICSHSCDRTAKLFRKISIGTANQGKHPDRDRRESCA